ncbi:methylated-DNA-[protein]-cysteine S-methyltransferase [Bacillus mesophilus]|uniref:Methylated-DNA--protein-cysteine methyltransferase n=1 Tax=Bacillus mesophilus TaxID=1808955 RepID=A0A6M0Q2A9_9BACI|nr:methylated-DNA--[protein]-cysteine S-methyltransferase [Bacillus mesophilus]MBM7659657.1 methylated-DNA-[protein]-cysteine S-methyltransferase [Bacillus mesophilus]NEY70525.1 methylated-DNA--[protein]-cysteine S-methyltransferase [Bacillus mesophilus]
MLYYKNIHTLLGIIYIVTSENHVVGVLIGEPQWAEYQKKNQDHLIQGSTKLLEDAVVQMEEYFKGTRMSFDLPLSLSGTDFQKQVWQVLQAIPYGETISYLDVAEKIDKPKAVRAVGQANRANKLPIIIACHRVIGKNKTLTGYAGNKVDLKEKLLQLEGSIEFNLKVNE